MKKTVNLWVILIATLVVLGGFFFLYSNEKQKGQELEAELFQANAELSQVQNEQDDLNSEYEQSSTDSYRENVARTVYHYMGRDEIHLVIDNPEALYEDGVVPQR